VLAIKEVIIGNRAKRGPKDASERPTDQRCPRRRRLRREVVSIVADVPRGERGARDVAEGVKGGVEEGVDEGGKEVSVMKAVEDEEVEEEEGDDHLALQLSKTRAVLRAKPSHHHHPCPSSDRSAHTSHAPSLF